MSRALAPRHRALTAAFAILSLAASVMFGVGLVLSTRASAAGQDGGFAATRTIYRTHLVNGTDAQVDKRTVTVKADVTQSLRDRQGVQISWSGAHPTGGVYFDANSENAGYAEYPMVILQCRGVDSPSAKPSQRLDPTTCFTQSPTTRYQPPYRGMFPPYRLDRYETPANRTKSVDAPNPRPASCPKPYEAERWVPFRSVDGTEYYGGQFGCAGLAPEQSVVQDALSPPNSMFATTDPDGTGSARFIVQDAADNASLGCSATVACAIVAIPIMGISCDAAAVSLPPADRPTDTAAAQSTCAQTGFYRPGDTTGDQRSPDPNSQTAVNGLLWWSASNWRNRITIPITMAPTAASCDIVGGGTPTNIYGSQYMMQATQQWAPTFCQDPKLFRLQHTQTSEIQAKNLLATSVVSGKYIGVKAAFQADPPQQPFSNPIVQAPTALSGFAIGYAIDDAHGHAYRNLKLDARLLAKLMTMSYPVYTGVRDDWASNDKYRALAHNPLDMSVDPEFLALNPGAQTRYINQFEASATLFMTSADTDVMTSFTSYINSDPEARAWLNGKADPWGMVVNPNYKAIDLPVTAWPQLDTYYNPLGNNCIADNHAAILPLIAAPVADPSQVTFNLQFGIVNSQVNCVVYGATDSPGERRLTGVGREQPGIRFLMGLISVADARRYHIDTAALQTHNLNSSDRQFSDATGRTFVEPTNAALVSAARQMRADDKAGTWTVPYDSMRTSDAGKSAYPGVLLLSTDVPTAGLEQSDADRFAKFLDYVAGPGQVPGEQNGQLAAGYVPLTAANGLGALHDYTLAAADAVKRQNGFVPKPSAPAIQPSPGGGPSHSGSGSPAPSGPPTATSGGSGPLGGGGNGGGANGGGANGGGAAGGGFTGGGPVGGAGPGAAPAPGNPAYPASRHSGRRPATPGTSPVPASGQPAPVALTTGASPGWSGFALPGLALIAVISGLLAALTTGLGRRR